MNWYKISRDLVEGQNQKSYLGFLQDSFSDPSAFPMTEWAVEESPASEILDQFTNEKKYLSVIDYIVCSLYPELEEKCRKYYEHGGEKIGDIYSPARLRAIDNLMTKAIDVFNARYQDVQGPQKDSTTPSISTPMSQEVSITPRQIYMRDDVIQEREDLAPSMLRRKTKK
jgi:hypothetical protein